MDIVIVLVNVLFLCRDTMTTATLIRKTLNRGLLTVSEVYFITVMVVNTVAHRQAWCWRDS